MKKSFVGIIIISVALLTSCLSNNSGESKSTDIRVFKISSIDSISLNGVGFNIKDINNYKSVITPKDSLPYNTKMDSIVVLVSGFKLKSLKIYESNNGVKTKEYDAQDQIPDTVNFSDTVYIETLAENGKDTRTYVVYLYAHQSDPDLYSWTGINSRVYTDNDVAQEKFFLRDTTFYLYLKSGMGVVSLITSNNGLEWTPQTMSNFPNGADIKYMFDNAGTFYLADGDNLYTSTDGLQWTSTTTSQEVSHIIFCLNSEVYSIDNSTLKLFKLNEGNWDDVMISTTSGVLPESFPIAGEAVWTDYSDNGVQRIYLVGGEDSNGNLLNTVWSTENGSYWVELGLGDNALFTPRRDVAVFQYDNKLMMLGGRDQNGVIADNIQLYSPDFGINWLLPQGNMKITSLFMPRYNAQVVLNHERTSIYVMGGQYSETDFIRDLWHGIKSSTTW